MKITASTVYNCSEKNASLQTERVTGTDITDSFSHTLDCRRTILADSKYPLVTL